MTARRRIIYSIIFAVLLGLLAGVFAERNIISKYGADASGEPTAGQGSPTSIIVGGYFSYSDLIGNGPSNTPEITRCMLPSAVKDELMNFLNTPENGNVLTKEDVADCHKVVKSLNIKITAYQYNSESNSNNNAKWTIVIKIERFYSRTHDEKDKKTCKLKPRGKDDDKTIIDEQWLGFNQEVASPADWAMDSLSTTQIANLNKVLAQNYQPLCRGYKELEWTLDKTVEPYCKVVCVETNTTENTNTNTD